MIQVQLYLLNPLIGAWNKMELKETMKELDFVLSNNIRLAKEGVEKFKKYSKQMAFITLMNMLLLFINLGIVIWIILIR